MNFDILKEMIESNKIEEAGIIIDELGGNNCIEAVPILIDYLKSTNNHKLRNKIALALSDIGSSEAVVPLINLLKDPRTLGSRGTLLYALEQFDCSEHLELLVDFLIEGNFEVSRQSLILIETINKQIPNDILQNCVSKLENEVETYEEKIGFLEEALEILTKLKVDNERFGG